ncbi:MAG: SRPBCC family protein [Actinomycetota bacterium]
MKETPAVERVILLPASPERVWSALTEGRELSAWFGAEVELEARPGGAATFRWPDGRSREATVEEMDPSSQALVPVGAIRADRWWRPGGPGDSGGIHAGARPGGDHRQALRAEARRLGHGRAELPGLRSGPSGPAGVPSGSSALRVPTP